MTSPPPTDDIITEEEEEDELDGASLRLACKPQNYKNSVKRPSYLTTATLNALSHF